ncbi:hypothetical protein CRUP_036605 [Coryphaenoides rupestris]|nr:hypothetical protein CRUP_036605 [Coryphaenoides rupestris]
MNIRPAHRRKNSPDDAGAASWLWTAATLVAVSVAAFLEKYGYLHPDNHIHNTAEVQSAIREFQWLSRLPVTGRLDEATLARMAEPRCGVTDEGTHDLWAQRINLIFTGRTALAGRRTLRRKRSSSPQANPPNHNHQQAGSVLVPSSLRQGLWSNVSGLVFQELPTGPADIRLAFYRGDHNDGASNAFDGPGGEGGPALSLGGSQVPSLLFWR